MIFIFEIADIVIAICWKGYDAILHSDWGMEIWVSDSHSKFGIQN